MIGYSKKQATISAKTFREVYLSKDRKKKKFNNKSQVYTSSIHGSRSFDSIKEANYCEELDWRLEAGEIKHYDLQYRIELRGLQNRKTGISYYVDFRVIDKNGAISYHEVKGAETFLWRLKWALSIQQIAVDEPGAELIVIK